MSFIIPSILWSSSLSVSSNLSADSSFLFPGHVD